MAGYHGGYFYPSASPLPNIYVRSPRSSKPKSTLSVLDTNAQASSTSPTSSQQEIPSSSPLVRSNSTSAHAAKKEKERKRSRFRHTRALSTGSTTGTVPPRGPSPSASRVEGARSGSEDKTHGSPPIELASLASSAAASEPSPPATSWSGRLRKSSLARAQAKRPPPASLPSPSAATPGSPLGRNNPLPHPDEPVIASTSPSFAAPTATATSPTSPASSKPGKLPTSSRIPFSSWNEEHEAMLTDHDVGKLSKLSGIGPFSRTDSVSSASGTLSLSNRTMASSEPSASSETMATRPFVLKNGRTYLNDPTLPYPLPVDLDELHRQSMRTLLLIQVFGGPVCSSAFSSKPPSRVLEIGCGSGFWSMMCHRYFRDRGHAGISFTGIDVAPLAPGGSGDVAKPDRDMKWRLVQHDIRVTPLPFPPGEFDLVMVKDMSLATTITMQQTMMDEYIRLLQPGGYLEIWESDHTVRMLRPHAAGAVSAPAPTPHGSGVTTADDQEEHDAAASLGAYMMNPNTPLSSPLNNFLVEYNGWLTRALEARDLSPVPCTLVGPNLLQESDGLSDVRSRRLAIPLSEVRWEKEGVGGVVTKDGKSYVETKGKGTRPDGERKSLSAGQTALRRTALMSVVQHIQSLEAVLREASHKSQDEWDVWMGKMMNDLVQNNGTSWGECLEVGAWWARKRRTR